VQLESANLGVQAPLVGFTVGTQSIPGSAQNAATSTGIVTAACCALTGVAYGIGVPPMTALIVGLSVPIAIFLLVVVTGRRVKPGS